MMGLNPDQIAGLDIVKSVPEVQGDLPASVDWRDEGKVSIVKDQGSCGSCWAFSTTGAVESAWAIANPDSEMQLFSESQLVDCATGEWLSSGCNGGWYYWAYDYLRSYKLETEADYPYTPSDQACAYDASKGVTNVSSYSCVSDLGTGGTRTAIQAAIAQGPSNVAVAAGNQYFQTYTGGVLSSTKCPTFIDHAILAVGYGQTETGTEYYIVKNSWGADWGEEGYIRIEATTDGAGICGVNQFVFFPTI